MVTSRKLSMVLIAAILVLTACGPGEESNTVKITLTDFGIKSSRTSFEVGVAYKFVVTNEGQANHEFMIVPPLVEDQMGMAMDMNKLDAQALAMIEDTALPPGATASFDFTFTESAPAGAIEFACHTPGHYEAGMKLEIVVK